MTVPELPPYLIQERSTESTIEISEQLRQKAAELMEMIDETIPILREQILAARRRRGENDGA